MTITKNSMSISQNLENKTTIWSSNPTSGYVIKGNEMSISKNIYTTMFSSTSFAIAKMYKHQRPWKDEWKTGTGKSGTCLHMCVHVHACKHTHTHTHTHRGILFRQRNILPFVTTQMTLADIMLSEIRQPQKDKHCIISFICEILKSWIYRIKE